MESVVVSTVSGSVNQSQATGRTIDEDVAGSSNCVSEEAAIGRVESVWDWTLQVGRRGRPLS